MTLVLFGWLWYDVVRHEVVDYLARELLKHFLGKLDGIVSKFLKRHELDNVTRHLSAKSIGEKRLVIRIEHVHSAKVCTADTDDDDRKRKV